MVKTETLLNDPYQIWKVGLVLYGLILLSFTFDVMNVSLIWNPSHFSFVPLFLFISAIKFPRLTPYSVAFCLGILTDILSYTPIGLMGGLYFLTVFLCRWQHRFILAQPFHVIWVSFILYWSIFTGTTWCFQSLYARYAFEITPSITTFLYGVFFFPLIWGSLYMLKNVYSESDTGLQE